MADFEQRLRELEDTLNDTENALNRDNSLMPQDDSTGNTGAKVPYMYIIGGLIPLLVACVLYFYKPRFVTKKVKGSYELNYIRLFMIVGIVAAICAAGLYLDKRRAV